MGMLNDRHGNDMDGHAGGHMDMDQANVPLQSKQEDEMWDRAQGDQEADVPTTPAAHSAEQQVVESTSQQAIMVDQANHTASERF